MIRQTILSVLGVLSLATSQIVRADDIKATLTNSLTDWPTTRYPMGSQPFRLSGRAQYDWLESLFSAYDGPIAEPDSQLPPVQPIDDLAAPGALAFNPSSGVSDTLISAGLTFSVDVFEDNLRDALDGRAVGYAYAIAYKGKLAKHDGVGYAQAFIEPGPIYQSSTKIMNIASISKMLTAIAVLQLLEKNGLSIDDHIAPWLPAEWDQGHHIHNLTFRHLLTHRSGFGSTNGVDWNGLRGAISGGGFGTVADDNDGVNDPGYEYSNSNFAMFRVIIPALWKASAEDPGIGEIDENSSAIWYQVYLQDSVFEPLGIGHALCTNVDQNPTLLYDFDDWLLDEGWNGGNWTDFCGGGGWYLSAVDIAKVMVYRRYTEVLLSQESRDVMDKHFLGWNAPDPWPNWTKGVYGTYLVHGGDLYDPDGDPSREMHGCAMQFPIQVEAVVLINSSTTLSQYQCTMLREAFENAWVAQ